MAKSSSRNETFDPDTPANTLLTVNEVADALRVSNMTVYRLVNADELTAFRVGRSVRIYAGSLRSYLNRRHPPEQDRNTEVVAG